MRLKKTWAHRILSYLLIWCVSLVRRIDEPCRASHTCICRTISELAGLVRCTCRSPPSNRKTSCWSRVAPLKIPVSRSFLQPAILGFLPQLHGRQHQLPQQATAYPETIAVNPAGQSLWPAPRLHCLRRRRQQHRHGNHWAPL